MFVKQLTFRSVVSTNHRNRMLGKAIQRVCFLCRVGSFVTRKQSPLFYFFICQCLKTRSMPLETSNEMCAYVSRQVPIFKDSWLGNCSVWLHYLRYCSFIKHFIRTEPELYLSVYTRGSETLGKYLICLIHTLYLTFIKRRYHKYTSTYYLPTRPYTMKTGPVLTNIFDHVNGLKLSLNLL